MISFSSSAKLNKEITLVLCTEEQVKAKKLALSNKSLTEGLSAAVKSKQFSGKKDQHIPLLSSTGLIVLVGLGKKKDLTPTALRIVVRKALLSTHLSEIKNVELVPADKDDVGIVAIIEGILLGTYQWDKYHSKKPKIRARDKNVTIVAAEKKVYRDAIVTCDGTNLTRDLINDNADVVTSSFLEKTVRGLIKGKNNVTVDILNRTQLKAKGLGLHLAVNQGSLNEPKLIIVKYNGAGKSGDYTALIGKGMTYDTGGLNLKPTGSIETMKMDMSGAAAVIGTLKNTLALKPKKNVLFVCGVAENVTGSGSYKPGDVIKGYAGKTVEVANTDAEGRLVLADAISYVVRNYKPKRIIDIATLTGACIVALGLDYTGLVTPDDKFARALVRVSNDTDDRIWRLPVYPELKDSVKSKIADISNLGSPRGAGGTITAAEFLHQFTEGTTWAHLDIAGTSYVEGDSRMYFGHGATGAGVRLLTNYLQNN